MYGVSVHTLFLHDVRIKACISEAPQQQARCYHIQSEGHAPGATVGESEQSVNLNVVVGVATCAPSRIGAGTCRYDNCETI